MPSSPATQVPHGRPLPWLGWSFSLLLPIAVLLLLVTIAFVDGSAKVVELKVTDTEGRPLPAAQAIVDTTHYLTDESGTVRLSVGTKSKEVTISKDGYRTMVGTLEKNTEPRQDVELESLERSQGDDLASLPGESSGATTLAARERAPSTPLASARTGTSVPASPTSQGTPTPDEIAGMVTNEAGEPVASAWVTDGISFAFTDAKGLFLFAEGTVAPGAPLTVFGSGYHQQQVPAPTDGQPLKVTLQLQKIRGIYYNPNISPTQEDVDRLINIANTTEVNAIVVDIKEELIFYDTQVPFFRDAGIVQPVLDLPAVLKQFQDNNIYTIARLVVFKDSAVAEKYPHLAVKDNVTGDLWRDMNGIAWVNPMLHELWDYNIELAYEAATIGFDEVQYDYVRFPTDGDLSRLDYGLENNQENREKSIESFLQRSHERLVPTGARLSADIFGYTVMVEDDLGIGQNLDQLAQHVDYLSPMVYPSHWPEGSMALDGHPNDFPYETIEISMGLAKQQLNGNGLKLRPWLQDFNIPGMKDYGDAEVRAQIDAAEDLGLSGWLIWDPNNWYHEGAFKAETVSSPQATPAATPRAISRGYGSTRGRRQERSLSSHVVPV